jgi:hypothetical protein
MSASDTSLIERLRVDAEWFAVPSSHDNHNELWETRDLLREAANELAAQIEPCTDAKEQGHGCYRAVKAENELAAQKEQYRVLTDEMLVMMDERNAAVLDAKENMDIANEFKKLMEQYRQHAEAAYIESARLVKMLALADEQIKENVKALKVAVEMLSATHDYSVMHPDQVLEYILKKTKEKK